MSLRHATVILAAAMRAAAVALSVSVIEPKKAEAARAVKMCGGGTIQLKAKEQRTVRLHNKERKSRGLRQLCVHPKLTKAARAHSRDMIRNDSFQHGSVGARLRRHGYNWRVYGENIAGGSGPYGRPANVFRRWMRSSGHRSNNLDRRFREIGLGVASGTYRGTRGYKMYTVDFGTRR
jgi:uncharacterized protein YkwD